MSMHFPHHAKRMAWGELCSCETKHFHIYCIKRTLEEVRGYASVVLLLSYLKAVEAHKHSYAKADSREHFFLLFMF